MIKPIIHSMLFYAIACSIPSIAQSNYSAGYVVMLSGDTLHGSIKYKQWDKNPGSIVMASTSGDETEYHPGSILGFSVAGEHYESAVVNVETSPRKLHELSKDPLPEFRVDTVFLQSLVRGKKRLLYLKDASGLEHFYIDDQGLKPLIYKKFVIITETNGLLRKMMDENVEYKRQLFFYLNNCVELQKRIEAARYEPGSLTKLFATYYECVSEPVDYLNKRKSLLIQMGFMVGGTQTELQFIGNNAFSYLLESVHNKSSTPSFGLSVDARLLRSRGITINNDLFYSSFDIRGKGVDYQGNLLESAFSYGVLKMHNLVQLSVVRTGSIFIEAGPSTAFFTRKNHHVTIEYTPGDKRERDFASRDYEFGVVGGIGGRWNRLGLNIRYERSTGISNYAQLAAKARRLHLFLKFRLSNS